MDETLRHEVPTPVKRLLVERGVAALGNIVLVSLLIFLLVRLAPGNPVDLLLPVEAAAEERQELARHWGLDRPLPVQYLSYAVNLMRGGPGDVALLPGARWPAPAGAHPAVAPRRRVPCPSRRDCAGGRHPSRPVDTKLVLC